MNSGAGPSVAPAWEHAMVPLRCHHEVPWSRCWTSKPTGTHLVRWNPGFDTLSLRGARRAAQATKQSPSVLNKRFLMIKEDEATEDDSTQGEPRQIIIVLNWFEELKDRVPTD